MNAISDVGLTIKAYDKDGREVSGTAANRAVRYALIQQESGLLIQDWPIRNPIGMSPAPAPQTFGPTTVTHEGTILKDPNQSNPTAPLSETPPPPLDVVTQPAPNQPAPAQPTPTPPTAPGTTGTETAPPA